MEKQLQNTVNDLLQNSIEAFNHGDDWMAGKIPDVVEQLLLWNFTTSLIANVFAWLGFVLVIVFAIEAHSKCVRDRAEGKSWTQGRYCGTSYDYDAAILIPKAVAVFYGAVLFFVYTSGVGLTWLQILIAPKFYLLEYAADFSEIKP